MARIVEAIGRYRTGALSCVEAAAVLGMSERHFRRLRDRYEAEGVEGLVDRRLDRASGRRVVVDRIEWVLEQYRTRYFDFTAKHFHERLGRVPQGGVARGEQAVRERAHSTLPSGRLAAVIDDAR
jgi:transposase